MSLVDYFPIDLAALIEKATLTTLKVVSFFTDIAIIDSESKLHWRREVISGVMNVWIDNIYYDGSFSSFIVIQSIAGTIIPVTPMPDLNLSDNVLDIINDGFDVFSITRNGDVVRCSASQAARTSSLANTVTSLLANDVGKVGQLDVKDELRSRGSSRPSVAVCISYGEDSFVMIDVEGSCYTLDVDQKKKITFDALKAIPNYSRLFLILTLGYLHIGEERQIKLPARAKDIAVVEKIDSSQQQSVAVEIIILKSLVICWHLRRIN